MRTVPRLAPVLLLTGAAVVLASVPAGAVGPAAAVAPYGLAWNVATVGLHSSSAAVGDFPAGRLAVIGDLSGHLHALRGDGTVAWDRIVDPVAGQPAAVESSAAIGNIDNSGQNSIVIGGGGVLPRNRSDNGGVVAYDGNGNVKWRFRTRDTFNTYTGGPPDGKSDGVTTTPAIGDVDGDGIPDVVFGSLDHFIYALRGTDGALIPGFPYDNRDTVFSSPALYDIRGTGRSSIVIGGDGTVNPPAGWTGKGFLRVLDLVGGSVRQSVVRQFNDIVGSSPTIADIDGDGRLEAVFSTGGFYNDNIDSHRLWAVHLDDGSDAAGWPVSTTGLLVTNPALGHVLADDPGRTDVVVGDRDGAVYAFRGNGTLGWRTLPGSQPGGRGNSGGGFDGGATIGDLQGNGMQDIAIPYGNGGALLIRGTNGSLIANVGDQRFASVSAPAIVDFGGTQGRQLIIGGFDPTDASFPRGNIASVRLPASTTPANSPLFRQTPDRVGAPRVAAGQVQSFVQALYADVLGRLASPTEITGWTRAIAAGADRGVAIAGFSGSTEYRQNVVTAAYQDVLNRVPERSGLDGWVANLAAGALTPDDLPRLFLQSNELYATAGGTDGAWVNALYQRALGRAASPGEQAGWAVTIQRAGRAEAVRGIYDSHESALRRVDKGYQRYLGRAAGGPEQQFWSASVIQAGDAALSRSLTGSTEYFMRARARY